MGQTFSILIEEPFLWGTQSKFLLETPCKTNASEQKYYNWLIPVPFSLIQ